MIEPAISADDRPVRPVMTSVVFVITLAVSVTALVNAEVMRADSQSATSCRPSLPETTAPQPCGARP